MNLDCWRVLVFATGFQGVKDSNLRSGDSRALRRILHGEQKKNSCVLILHENWYYHTLGRSHLTSSRRKRCDLASWNFHLRADSANCANTLQCTVLGKNDRLAIGWWYRAARHGELLIKLLCAVLPCWVGWRNLSNNQIKSTLPPLVQLLQVGLVE